MRIPQGVRLGARDLTSTLLRGAAEGGKVIGPILFNDAYRLETRYTVHVREEARVWSQCKECVVGKRCDVCRLIDTMQERFKFGEEKDKI